MMSFNAEDFAEDKAFKEYVANIAAESVRGIETKNSELLNELKVAKAKAKLVENIDIDDLKNIDIEDLKNIEGLKKKAAFADDFEKKKLEDRGEYEKLIDTAKAQHEETVNKLQGEVDTHKNALKSMLINGQLSSALAKVNCNPVLLESASKLLSTEVSAVEKDGGFEISVGSETIEKYVEKWAKSDVGKNFVLAKQNSGGGSNGDGGSGGVSEEENYFNPESPQFNLTKQIALKQSNSDFYNRMKKKYPDKKQAPAVIGIKY